MDKTVCELFAGVGGFRLGLEKSNKDWNTVWFNQWEPSNKTQWAHGCYVYNFGDIEIDGLNTNADIETINKHMIPNHSLLVGGFPCQDYSVARGLHGEKGIHGKKGVLWWSIRETIEAKNPPFILLENVDRLLKSPSKQRGRDFGIILACLNQLDYSVEWRVVNAAKYGGAQKRRRIFIFAYKNSTKYFVKNNKLEPEEIIYDKGLFAKTFPVVKSEIKLSKKEFEFNSIEQISNSFKYTFENTGYCIKGAIYTSKTIELEETPITLDEILQNRKKYGRQYYQIENKYFIPDEKLFYSDDRKNHYDEENDGDDKKILLTWQYLKGAKRRKRVSKNGHKYKFSEGPVPFPEHLDKPGRTMLTSEGTFNRSTHVIKDPNRNKYRLITPIEAERLQGFDDNWTKYSTFKNHNSVEIMEMPERKRYFCMGNALVVPMITRMAKTLEFIIDEE